ncbi:ABC transporter permease [Prosthecomicrobium sp. N25]|uniref:ABC transporter permease n=1 Tax=Prosthecomicrobium sp. N25 TaxID=3129254 RepID=UPI0030775BFA
MPSSLSDTGAPASPRPVHVIEASTRPVIDLAQLWAYRELLYFLVWRDLKVRYRQTLLGVAWAVLQPLAGTAVFTLVFGRLVGVPSEGAPYALFVLCGLVPWTFFARGLTNMTGSLVSSQDLVKRVYFPRLAIPLAAVGSCLVDLAVGLGLVLLAILATGHAPSAQVLLLPVVLVVLLAVLVGLGLILAAVNARYRDVGHLVPMGLQILLFLTPVVYPGSLLPASWRLVYGLNPMVGVVEGFRWCLLGTPLDPALAIGSAAIGAVLLAAGLAVFARAEKTFADVV